MANLPINNLSLKNDIKVAIDDTDVQNIQSLSEAFQYANSNGFDSTYNVAGTDNMSEFKNYNHDATGGGGGGGTTVTVSTSITGDVAAAGGTIINCIGVSLSDSQTNQWTITSSEAWCTFNYSGTSGVTSINGTGTVSTGFGSAGISLAFTSNEGTGETRSVDITITMSGSTGNSITLTQDTTPAD